MRLIPGVDQYMKTNLRLDASLLRCTLRSRARPSFQLRQQPLRFLLRQSASHHLLRHSLLAIKLVAFCELAFVKVSKQSSHPGVNERSSGLDGDGDLIVVAVARASRGGIRA